MNTWFELLEPLPDRCLYLVFLFKLGVTQFAASCLLILCFIGVMLEDIFLSHLESFYCLLFNRYSVFWYVMPKKKKNHQKSTHHNCSPHILYQKLLLQLIGLENNICKKLGLNYQFCDFYLVFKLHNKWGRQPVVTELCC